MRTIKELVDNNEKRVYIYLADAETGDKFLEDAKKEGYTYEDGAKLAEREPDNFYAINRNKTICFINGMGRMAFQCGADYMIRIDYKKYINGDSDYFYKK